VKDPQIEQESKASWTIPASYFTQMEIPSDNHNKVLKVESTQTGNIQRR